MEVVMYAERTPDEEARDVRRDVREIISETDRLSRLAYAKGHTLSAHGYATLRTAACKLDRALGSPLRRAGIAGAIDLFYQRISDRLARASADERAQLRKLVDIAAHMLAVDTIFRERGHGTIALSTT
jgi:hypothetical protein